MIMQIINFRKVMFELVIVFVIDNYGEFTNGTTVTAKRSKERLEARGHTVRLVSAGELTGDEYYRLKKRFIPIVSQVSKKQSVYFAKYDKELMMKAYEGADIIHFFLPFQLTHKGIMLAKKMEIPCTAAFHSQPENITYGMGLGKFGRPIASLLYQKFKNSVYRHVSRVHCPSTFIVNEMKHNGYKNDFHVISNGISEIFSPSKVNKDESRRQILSIGRYAFEKKQDVVIKAVSLSKYKQEIKLVLAGAGPREKSLKRLANKLNVETEFGFLDQSALLNKIHSSTLYIHAAEAEIEGISCLEAISCGVVPIIAKAKKSAATQFVIDERSVFPAGKPKALAKQIDYWLDNEEARNQMSIKYAEHAKKYNIEHSIDLLEEMFTSEISDYKREQIAKTKSGKKIKKSITFPYQKRALSFLVYYFIAFPFLWIYLILIRGVQIINRKELTKIKGGAVIISNHVHPLDSAMSGLASFPKKPVFTGIRENFKLPVAGYFVTVLGTVPVPETVEEMKVFFLELKKQAQKGRFIHFFPEGELIKYDNELRPFKKGAFNVAEEASVPIVPIGISFLEKKGIFPLLAPNRVVLTVGEAIYPDMFKLKKDSILALNYAAFESMNGLIH